MKYKLITLCFISIQMLATSAEAGFFDGKKELYECASYEAANTCNSSCKTRGKFVEFKVNVNTGVVLMILSNSSTKQTFALENCSVANEKNWVCSTPRDWNALYYHSVEDKMVNGIYQGQYERGHRVGNYGPFQTDEENYACTK